MQTFTLVEGSTPHLALALTGVFTHILTIPSLLYSIPVPSLTHLSSEIPFANLPLLDLTPFTSGSVSGEEKVHLIATLHALTPPRYQKLEADALVAYLRLLTLLLNATPISTLNPPEKRGTNSEHWDAAHDLDSDSDSDSHGGSRSRRSTSVSIVSAFDSPQSLPPPIPTPDPRTLKRLATLPSPTHIAALLSCKEIHTATVLPSLIECLIALSTVWPAVLGAILARGTGILREVYREFVRGSQLGKDTDGISTLLDPKSSREWPPLLLLVDLYEQALRTMGDDEFFGNSGAGSVSHTHVLGSSSSSGLGSGVVGTTQAHRNPLTLDELRAFSRQLLNIAFMLYWREDGGDVGMGIMAKLVGAGNGGAGTMVRCTWEGVREKVTRCLVAIHAREWVSLSSFPVSFWFWHSAFLVND